MRQAGTWDALLQCLHLDIPQATKYKETVGLKITVLVQLGQILGKMFKETKKTQLPF